MRRIPVRSPGKSKNRREERKTMTTYRKIDKDTVEKTETVVENIKLPRVSEEIKMIGM